MQNPSCRRRTGILGDDGRHGEIAAGGGGAARLGVARRGEERQKGASLPRTTCGKGKKLKREKKGKRQEEKTRKRSREQNASKMRAREIDRLHAPATSSSSSSSRYARITCPTAVRFPRSEDLAKIVLSDFYVRTRSADADHAQRPPHRADEPCFLINWIAD